MSTYTIKVSCSNCGFEGAEEKEFGHFISITDKSCPNCGCKSLKESKYISPTKFNSINKTERW